MRGIGNLVITYILTVIIFTTLAWVFFNLLERFARWWDARKDDIPRTDD
jgi:hypothetical protein